MMMNEPIFAIVDIETTGGNPYNGGGITEIGIIVFNGKKVIQRYQSLINPKISIPQYITGLTGINDQMVKDSPTFEEIAVEIYAILKDKVFVAHNVNFDYSFLRAAFLKVGIALDVPKLCTVRLSRKTFPGYKSYSLGRLCESLEIQISDRHRAMGDAEATVILFESILQQNPQEIFGALKKNAKDSFLPPNISLQQYQELPENVGVYYFHDQQGKIIYVGKANNIKSRFKSHFSGNSPKGKYVGMKSEVHSVTYQVTGNELLALLIELQEIKRLWPKYNQAQKFAEENWYLIQYDDGQGYSRLQLSKKRNIGNTVMGFESFAQARSYLFHALSKYELCPKLCGIQKTIKECYDYQEDKCKGACGNHESLDTYNARVGELLNSFSTNKSDLALEQQGRTPDEKAVLFFENEIFIGYRFANKKISTTELKNEMITVKSYQESKAILRRYLTIGLEN
jgi:DNA polymerase III subunit epsilon